MNLKKLVLVLGVFGGLVAGAMAQTIAPANVAMTTNINVSSAAAVASCTLGGTGTFNTLSYVTSSPTDVTSSSILNLNCTGSSASIPYTLSANSGNNPNPTFTRRGANTTQAGQYINYQIKTIGGQVLDSSPPAFGGVTLPGATTPLGSTSSGATISLNIVIGANQNVLIGTYNDVVQLTATF